MKPFLGTNNRIFIQPIEEKKLIIESTPAMSVKGIIVDVTEQDDKGVKPILKKGDTVYIGNLTHALNMEHSEYGRIISCREMDIVAIFQNTILN